MGLSNVSGGCGDYVDVGKRVVMRLYVCVYVIVLVLVDLGFPGYSWREIWRFGDLEKRTQQHGDDDDDT